MPVSVFLLTSVPGREEEKREIWARPRLARRHTPKKGTFVPPPPWNRCLDVALFHYDAAYSGRKVSDGIDRGSRCQKAFYPL